MLLEVIDVGIVPVPSYKRVKPPPILATLELPLMKTSLVDVFNAISPTSVKFEIDGVVVPLFTLGILLVLPTINYILAIRQKFLNLLFIRRMHQCRFS